MVSAFDLDPDSRDLHLVRFLAAPKPAAAAGGPPPPPPPPPPGLFADAPAAKSEPTGVNALFADINRGDDVTKGERPLEIFCVQLLLFVFSCPLTSILSSKR